MAQAMLRAAAFMLHGNNNSTQQAYEKAKTSAWWPLTERALSGKPLANRIVAVSGANAGVGFAVASRLAALGATTLMLCRSLERGRAAAEAIRKESGGQAQVEVEEVDVASPASVAAFAARLEASGRALHCLINNAGVLALSRAETPDGWEASFATNVAGTVALTLALKPALLRAAAQAQAQAQAQARAAAVPRVVFVSSGGMYSEPLLSSAPLDPPASSAFDGTRAYARDKRRQVALAEALARRWSGDAAGGRAAASAADAAALAPPPPIAVASYHPGWSDTPGVQTSLPAFRKAFEAKLRRPEGGADTAVWLCCAPVDWGGGGAAAAAAAAAEGTGAEGAAQDASKEGFLVPGAFYLDRRPQPKHLLGASGRVAGTAYAARDADALLDSVAALLRDKGYAAAV